MKSKTYQKVSLLLAVMLALALPTGSFLAVLGDTDDSATGSFTLNATPSVSGVDFCDDAYGATSTLTPDATTYFRLNWTITLSSQMGNLKNITVWIFDDSECGGNYNTSGPTGLNNSRFSWIESSDTWAVDNQGSLTEWSVDGSGSLDPGVGGSETVYEFSMRFRISRAARYDTDWNCSIHAYDDDTPTPECGYGAESATVTMNQNFEIAYSSSSFTWGADVLPNSDNNTHGSLTMTVRANDNWQIQVNATDFNTSGESDVDIEANNILAWDQDGSNDGISMWVRNTITTMPTGSTWDNQNPMDDESGIQRNVYYFLSPGSFFVVGKEWNTTVTLWVQANS